MEETPFSLEHSGHGAELLSHRTAALSELHTELSDAPRINAAVATEEGEELALSRRC